jgi:hypothetical protein
MTLTIGKECIVGQEASLLIIKMSPDDSGTVVVAVANSLVPPRARFFWSPCRNSLGLIPRRARPAATFDSERIPSDPTRVETSAFPPRRMS